MKKYTKDELKIFSLFESANYPNLILAEQLIKGQFPDKSLEDMVNLWLGMYRGPDSIKWDVEASWSDLVKVFKPRKLDICDIDAKINAGYCRAYMAKKAVGVEKTLREIVTPYAKGEMTFGIKDSYIKWERHRGDEYQLRFWLTLHFVNCDYRKFNRMELHKELQTLRKQYNTVHEFEWGDPMLIDRHNMWLIGREVHSHFPEEPQKVEFTILAEL